MKEKNGNSEITPVKTISFIGMVFFIVVVLGLVVDVTKAENENFYADIIRLDNVANKIHQNYVEEISSKDLVDKAIEGMIGVLDPHTSFFQEKQYEELRIHTEGKFGGLGIQISIRDKILTVMTPISGTPASRAGIQSGDQIIKIEGKSTKGISIEDAVNKLRGEPGTEVSITIRRKGEREDIEYTITREIITIKSVPYYGVLDNNVGYIRLLTFSQEAGEEVEKAIKNLLEKNIRYLIFDLRHNPGGLLPEAIDVASKFLDRKSLVVSTRGRVPGQNKEYYAKSKAVLPESVPLVVLVSASSASASEIVAGAIQDWDRGIIIGDTTFGKGSVQTIIPLDKEHHLKLTTAFYYTPSGRCINKPENAVRGSKANEYEYEGEESADESPDSVTSADSIRTDTTKYRTNSGRIVYGGGGIIPDTIVDLEEYSLPIISLLSKDVFFKFANVIYPKLRKKNRVIDSNFVVDEKIVEEFYAYFDSIDFAFKNYARLKFEEFKEKVGLVDSLKDTSETRDMPKFTEDEQVILKEEMSKLEGLLEKEEKREIEESQEEIEKFIKNALLVRERGQDDPLIYRISLEADRQVKVAISLLSDNKIYKKLLSSTE